MNSKEYVQAIDELDTTYEPALAALEKKVENSKSDIFTENYENARERLRIRHADALYELTTALIGPDPVTEPEGEDEPVEDTGASAAETEDETGDDGSEQQGNDETREG